MPKAYTGTDAETGKVFYITRRDLAAQRDPNFSEVEVPTTQKELLPFLEELANDVPVRDQEEAPPPVAAPAQEPSPSDIRLAFEEAFEGFPLALQLHYAALACENARTEIKK